MTLSSWNPTSGSKNQLPPSRSSDGSFGVLVRAKAFLALPCPIQEGFPEPRKVGVTLGEKKWVRLIHSLNLAKLPMVKTQGLAGKGFLTWPRC